MDNFFREHLKWCIVVHLAGGDVNEDYDFWQIADFQREMGFGGDSVAMLDDERWSSVIGREVLYDLIQAGLANKHCDSDFDAGCRATMSCADPANV